MKKILYPLLFLVLSAFPALAGESEEEEEKEERILTAADIPARIADAEVGEWALYRLNSGKNSRLTVVEKWREGGDTHLVIQIEQTNPKDKKSRPRRSEERITVRESVADLRDLGPEDRVTATEVLVHGRKIDAVVINFIEHGQLVRQSYLSDKIPVYGLIRGINNQAKARIALNLLDYGFADDEP